MPNKKHLKKGTTGTCINSYDAARCVLIRDAPAEQGMLEIVLLDDFTGCEAGSIIEIPRREFRE